LDLDTDGQINKLCIIDSIAESASKSADIDRRLGAFLLYAGFVDYLTIQAARLFEQIILKKQLTDAETASFHPHSDIFFYDEHVSTRRIFKEIKRHLPFSFTDQDEAKKINESAQKMIKHGDKFLSYRNTIVHHIGNPTKTFEDVIDLCDKAFERYKEFKTYHLAFMTAAQPYSFSEKELEYWAERGIKIPPILILR